MKKKPKIYEKKKKEDERKFQRKRMNKKLEIKK